MFWVAFVEFANLRVCGSSRVKKKVKVDSGVTVAKEDEVDNVCASMLGGVIHLCTFVEFWLKVEMAWQ